MSNAAKHVIFTGMVQGVGFRFTVLGIARRCQLTGTVRNLHDGSVEMIVQGYPEDISDCIRGLQETFGSNIKDTKLVDMPFNPRHTDFKITY